MIQNFSTDLLNYEKDEEAFLKFKEKMLATSWREQLPLFGFFKTLNRFGRIIDESGFKFSKEWPRFAVAWRNTMGNSAMQRNFYFLKIMFCFLFFNYMTNKRTIAKYEETRK